MLVVEFVSVHIIDRKELLSQPYVRCLDHSKFSLSESSERRKKNFVLIMCCRTYFLDLKRTNSAFNLLLLLIPKISFGSTTVDIFARQT